MKKTFPLLILLSLLVSAALSQAQTPVLEWVKSAGSQVEANGLCIATDTKGNIYTAGTFATATVYIDSFDFNFEPNVPKIVSNGSYDVFLIKQDARGNLLWMQSFGGAGQEFVESIAVDTAGNCYLTGSFKGTSKFDPSSSGTTYTSHGGGPKGQLSSDIFLSKFDTDGNFQWVRVAGNSSGNENGSGVAVSPSGDVLVTGSLLGTIDFAMGNSGPANLSANSDQDIFVLRVDGNGNLVWAKNFGAANGGSYPYDITVSESGNIYATGYYYGDGNFDPDQSGNSKVENAGYLDIFVLKLDPSGKFVWVKGIGGADEEESTAIAVDANENVYVTGVYRAVVNFNPSGNFELTSSGAGDIFILKLDKDGNFGYARSAGSPDSDDRGQGIAVDAAGNVYTTGFFQGYRADFNPGTGAADTFYIDAYSGSGDGFVLKLDNEGNFGWAMHMGCEVPGRPTPGYGIAASNGSVSIIGNFTNTANFNPSGKAGVDTMTSRQDLAYNAYIMKLFDCSNLKNVEIGGPNQVCIGMPVTYTTPSLGIEGLSYQWVLPEGWNGESDSSSITVVPDAAGSLTLTVTSACGTTIGNINLEPLLSKVEINVNGFVLGITNNSAYHLWQWYRDGQEIPGATDSVYKVLENGRYSVVVESLEGCIDTAYYTVTNVGLSDPSLTGESIQVFPNPAKDLLFVNCTQPVNAALYSIDGRIAGSYVITTQQNDISIAHLVAGMYLLQITDMHGQLLKVVKVVKE